MPNITLTLQSVVNLASTHADLLPLSGVGGYSNQPALDLCTDAASEIINDDTDWKWNAQELSTANQPLITSANKQDYLFAGATAFVLGGANVQSCGAALDLSTNNAITVTSGVVTVVTLENHRFAVGTAVYLLGVVMSIGAASAYTSTHKDDGVTSQYTVSWVITAVTSNTFSFAATNSQLNGDVGGAPGINDFGWIDTCQMRELNNISSPPNIRQLRGVRDVVRWGRVADPEEIALVMDLGTGVLKFRFYYVPGSVIWSVGISYQKASPTFTALTQTWAPIPDMYSSLVRQALLYRMYRYLNSPTAPFEYQKLQQELQKARGRDSAEESNTYIVPEDSLVDNGFGWF